MSEILTIASTTVLVFLIQRLCCAVWDKLVRKKNVKTKTRIRNKKHLKGGKNNG